MVEGVVEWLRGNNNTGSSYSVFRSTLTNQSALHNKKVNE